MQATPTQLPTGQVTFLFTDVVGSTRLWAQDTESMSDALRLHDRLVADAIERCHGAVFATAGDSFAAAFAKADDAAECAQTIQRALREASWGAGPRLTVRVGLHLGRAEERDGNYFGPPVNQAARVMQSAQGGQCPPVRSTSDRSGVASTTRSACWPEGPCGAVAAASRSMGPCGGRTTCWTSPSDAC